MIGAQRMHPRRQSSGTAYRRVLAMAVAGLDRTDHDFAGVDSDARLQIDALLRARRPALRLMIDAAHRYHGYIVRSTGDGIFALFGAPVAHEDYPLRAFYAGLRMQEDVRPYDQRGAGCPWPNRDRPNLSRAILVYLAEKTGPFLTAHGTAPHSGAATAVLADGGVEPMAGQAQDFRHMEQP